jgi:undecaprenyl-diphosphatase
MNLFWSACLGVLQGLTEFLPVSSSGHLAIAQHLIPGFSQPGVLFDVVLHSGTFFAVIFYFRKRLLKITPGYIGLLIVGSIPAGLIGFLFRHGIENLFSDVKLVGIALLFTAIMNFLTDKKDEVKKDISAKDSFLVGVAQALALIPGISRSGSTIFAGSSLGINKKEAAEFSFLLSVPAVFGANLLEFLSHEGGRGITPGFYIVGFSAALVSGYVAIYFAIKFLLAKKFRFFGVYCLLIGLLVVLL